MCIYGVIAPEAQAVYDVLLKPYNLWEYGSHLRQLRHSGVKAGLLVKNSKVIVFFKKQYSSFVLLTKKN
jgi:hypothetical protein